MEVIMDKNIINTKQKKQLLPVKKDLTTTSQSGVVNVVSGYNKTRNKSMVRTGFIDMQDNSIKEAVPTQNTTKEKKFIIRYSQKHKHVLDKLEETATNRGIGLTDTIIEFLNLAFKAYDRGFRIVDNDIIKITPDNTIMNIDKEVGRSIFSSFAGAIHDLKRFENMKSIKNQDKIEFYSLATKALASEYANFSKFTDDEVNNTLNKIAPILKSCVLAKNNEEKEIIMEDNKQLFLALIEKTGVRL